MTLVKIKPGLSHSKYSGGDVFDASPAEMVSFGDKFVVVVEDEEEFDVVYATPAALSLAEEQGISLSLSDIAGSGKDGKITKADVEALLEG